MSKRIWSACALGVSIAGLLAVGASAAPEARTDWPNYGNDRGAMRYSPLAQITPENVTSLKVAWTYHMKPADATRIATSETTPLVVGNIMYLGSPYGHIVALDATTGKEIWNYKLPGNTRPAPRGIAYWPGDKDYAPEILFGTNDGKLVAIDVKIGQPASKFGENGFVNLRTPEIMRGYDKNYALTSPAGIYRNLIITGASNPEEPRSVSGDERAWDVRTGKLVWTFHAVPRKGEFGYDTWAPGSTENRSGVNIWNMITVDDKRGIVFLPFTGPASDRWGGDRHGANLFGNSLVAVDAMTGKRLWHFQLLHHEVWDWDQPTPPMLFDVKRDGKTIPAVAAMNKSGYMFILNRLTGKPLYDVKEVPVPKSNVEGEETWPTQPVPVTPPPLATRQSFTAATDVTNITPELHDFCEKLIATHHLHDSVPFSPLTSDSQIARFPGSGGGPEWGGGAFDPKLGYFIVNTQEMGSIEQLEKKKGGYWASANIPDSFFEQEIPGHGYYPCQDPPWGDLWAVNVNTGKVAWRVNLGVSDIMPEGKQNTGRPNLGAPLTTASGLIFIGATDDSRFRAFDTKTGKELWTFKLDASAHASPVTYKGTDGKQYVAVVATGGAFVHSPPVGDSLVVFALP
ncbi:MAG TPA: PQQ-binding-like beta-propeller repeat protein [Rhizomicrobium sp.]|jgi:quinoprotein glucose dehydrogenase